MILLGLDRFRQAALSHDVLTYKPLGIRVLHAVAAAAAAAMFHQLGIMHI